VNILNMSRQQLRLVLQVVTGHNTLNSHLYKLNLVPTPMCPCGLERETGYHFIGECDRYAMIRLAIL